MRIAILGCAHMHASGYMEAFNKIEDVVVIGIAEEDTIIGKEFAEKFGLKYFKDYNEILKEDVDVVIICSANSKHKAMAIAAARAGKHVIVEKPIATTIKDAEEMISECRKNNVKLMISFPVRYSPAIARTKEIIDNGDLGQIVAIAGTNHGTMPGGWFIDKKLSGGGAVMDHTVHVADLMHWMLKSDIKDVYCKMGTKIHDIPVEDCGLLSLEFDNGTYATLDASWNRPESFPTWGDVTMEIIGTKGTINVDAFAQHGNLYSNNMKYSSQVSWGDDMNYLMVKDFIKCVREDLPSPVTGEDGLFALKIALMAYKSAEKNEVVTGL